MSKRFCLSVILVCRDHRGDSRSDMEDSARGTKLLLTAVEHKFAEPRRGRLTACGRHRDGRDEHKTGRGSERCPLHEGIPSAVIDDDRDGAIMLSHVHDLALNEIVILSRYKRRSKEFTGPGLPR